MHKDPSAFKSQLHVKENENITWNWEQEWLPQLISHLELYLGNPRRKNSAHQIFAQNLLNIAQGRLTTMSHIRSIDEVIIPLIREKKFLTKKGWDGKTSYLYALCDYALMHFNNFKMLEMAKERIAESYQQGFEHQTKELEESREYNIKLKESNEELLTKCQEIEWITQLTLKRRAGDFLILDAQLEKKNKINKELRDELEKVKKELSQKMEGDSAENRLMSSPKFDTDAASRLSEYEIENKALTKALQTKTKQVEQLTQVFAKISKENQTLSDKLINTEQEVSLLRRTLNRITSFFDGLFGSYFREKTHDYFTKEGPEPEFSDTQINLIKIITTNPSLTPTFMKACGKTAEKLKEGKKVMTESAKHSLDFLSDQFSKLKKPKKMPSEDPDVSSRQSRP